MTDFAYLAAVIGHFEGFISVAKWDVNAFRIGFGSDTRWNGTADVAVKKGDYTTRPMAIINLAHRLVKFEQVIIHQIGEAEWRSLPRNAQAALMSVCYNYGSLPTNVFIACKSGNVHIIADAIRERRRDNGGINAWRRDDEAHICESRSDVT
jgi:GH24 family phage-related lysozyme (muramidase)